MNNLIYLFITYVLIYKINCSNINNNNGPIIKLPQGDIQGVYMETPNGKIYEAYLGVRYAKPPVEDLRFKEAQPVEPWIGTYNASTYGSDCLQFNHFSYSVIGSEDCLFMNIYKPVNEQHNDGKLYDVMVHIHGGAFMFLSSKAFQPDKLMDYDIVYFSLNYRLGPLGFMSTGDKILPGNLGLKDQSFAIKWAKENAKYFNGNENKITLSGVSAGGVSVHLHYLTPLSRGLFQRGISGSGAALNPWALTEDVPKKTQVIASRLGCPTTDSTLMVKCLNSRPAEQIVSQIPIFLKWLYNPFTPFGPVVEPEDAERPFITRHPYDIIKDGQMAQLPWMCSFTTEEGLYPAAEFVGNKELLQDLQNNWFEIAPHLLDYNYTVSTKDEKIAITEKISKYYFKDKKITKGVKELIQMIGDRIFGAGIVQSALLQAASSKAPVYLYTFGYRGKYSASEFISHSDTDFGVCHADDAGYILHSMIYKMDQTENDRTMGKRMRNIWISFMKTGVPEFFENEPLPTVSKSLSNIKYLEILGTSRDKTTAKTVTDLGEFKFWSTLPINEKLTLPNKLNEEL